MITRDVLVLETDCYKIVISADSVASIGNMPRDEVKVDPFLVGKLSARVVLFEVLAVGADPVAIVNNIGLNYNDSKQIIEGIKHEAGEIPVFGSTEDNFPSDRTFLSIFCIGLTESLKIGQSKPDDLVIAIGKPYVGYEIVENQEELPDLNVIKKLKEMGVHDIFPTGSRGVIHEIKMLEKESGLKFKIMDDSFPLMKSCGPSSVLLITAPERLLSQIKELKVPCSIIGVLTK